MAHRSADVARNAFRFFREDAEARKPCVDVHQCGERTGKPAPHSSTEPEVHTDTDDAGEENVYDVIVVQLNSKNGPAG